MRVFHDLPEDLRTGIHEPQLDEIGRGTLSNRDVKLLDSHICVSHSNVEDLMLMTALGDNQASVIGSINMQKMLTILATRLASSFFLSSVISSIICGYMAVEMALAASRESGGKDVCLSGGSFQNQYILRRLPGALEKAGLRPRLHRRVSCNDEGISLGQLMIGAASLDE